MVVAGSVGVEAVAGFVGVVVAEFVVVVACPKEVGDWEVVVVVRRLVAVYAVAHLRAAVTEQAERAVISEVSQSGDKV